MVSIYFVQPLEGGLIKIGRTTSLAIRMSQLQAHFPAPLILLALIAEDEHHTEFGIHRQFQNLREHGEWFRPERPLTDYIRAFGQEARPMPKTVAAERNSKSLPRWKREVAIMRAKPEAYAEELEGLYRAHRASKIERAA